ALNSGKITKDVINEILNDLREGKKINLEKYKVVDYSQIEKEIKKIIQEKKDLSVNAIMGILMSRYKGKISGNKLIGLIQKYKK
ncbi:MAG: hypothetical protein AABX55_02180, partial [Nanoarchaeota archaeon]